IIISATGGSGSSFLINSFHRFNYNLSNFNPKMASRTLRKIIDIPLKLINEIKIPLKIPSKISKLSNQDIQLTLQTNNYYTTYDYVRDLKNEVYNLVNIPFKFLLKFLKLYNPKLKILPRPDGYWTEAMYDPNNKDHKKELYKLKLHILRTKNYRSGGLKINPSKIETDSMKSLVKSYIKELARIEKKKRLNLILLSSSWGERGFYKDLDFDTIYLIRDPFNSLISYSKSMRHEYNFLKRGLKNINTKTWIDAYLEGPERYWINHARTMLDHKKGVIIRYNNFKEDWKKVKGLPDISPFFKYKENNIQEILTQESIEYIRFKTEKLCKELNIPLY
ncbi:MAG: hypothetical protein ACFFDH_25240, partial [Promethearchaeota archaeon]